MLYRSDMEEHKLDCLRGQIPFEETISMDGVNELDPVDVTAELEDINIGIINSRKLSVRALVMLEGRNADAQGDGTDYGSSHGTSVGNPSEQA